MAAIEQQTAENMDQAAVEALKVATQQLLLDFRILPGEHLIQLLSQQVLVDELLAGLAVPEVHAEAQLVVGVLRQICGTIRFHGGVVIRVVGHDGIHVETQIIPDVDLPSDVHHIEAAGSCKQIGQGGQRRINAGVVAPQVYAVVRQCDELRNGGRRIRRVAEAGIGIVRVQTLDVRGQKIAGQLGKAGHVVDHNGIGGNVDYRPVAAEIGDRIGVALAGEGHALGQVGVLQIETVVEFRDAHVGHVGHVLVAAHGGGLGGIQTFPHHGQGLFGVGGSRAFTESTAADDDEQHHRQDT